jgi:hypothetical protein
VQYIHQHDFSRLWLLDADNREVLLFLAKLKIENAKKMIFWGVLQLSEIRIPIK